MFTTFAAPLGSLTIEPLAECEYSADRFKADGAWSSRLGVL